MTFLAKKWSANNLDKQAFQTMVTKILVRKNPDHSGGKIAMWVNTVRVAPPHSNFFP